MTDTKVIILHPTNFEETALQFLKRDIPLYKSADADGLKILIFLKKAFPETQVKGWIEKLTKDPAELYHQKPKNLTSLERLTLNGGNIESASHSGRPNSINPFSRRNRINRRIYGQPRTTVKKLLEKYGNKIKYCEEERRFYIYQNPCWRNENHKDSRVGLNELFVELQEDFIHFSETVVDEHEQHNMTLEEAQDAARDWGYHAEKMASTMHFLQTETLLKKSRAFRCSAEQFDQQDYLFNTPECIVDLRTGEKIPHNPDMMLRLVAGANYKLNCRNEFLEKSLSEICDGREDCKKFLQIRLGSALFGNNVEQKALMFYGPSSSNGKTTILKMLTKCLGDYAKDAKPDTFISRSEVGGNRGDLTRLSGARLVTTSEPPNGKPLDTATFKRMSGGDTLVESAKFQAEQEFQAKWLTIIATNEFIPLLETGKAVWRRLEIFPFTKQFQYDPEFDKQWNSQEVRDAFLSWVIEGAIMWYNDYNCRIDEYPQKMLDSATEYRIYSDTVFEYFHSQLYLAEGASEQLDNVYLHYESRTRRMGRRPVSEKNFVVRLETIRSELEGMNQRSFKLIKRNGEVVLDGAEFFDMKHAV